MVKHCSGFPSDCVLILLIIKYFSRQKQNQAITKPNNMQKALCLVN